MWFEAKSAGGKVFRVNVKESGVRFNYSQMQYVQSQGGFGWQTIQGHTDKMYAKIGGDDFWYYQCPVTNIANLIRFPIGDDNCITMSTNPDEQFYDGNASHNRDGAIMTTADGSNFKFSFFTKTEQGVSYAHMGGFFMVNPWGYIDDPIGFNGMFNTFYIIYESDEEKIPAMSFWLLTMHDDVQSSETYGQDFDIIMVCIRGGNSGGGVSHESSFNLFDARMFKGASNLTPTKSTTRGNSPTGWTGGRNDHSDSDTVSHIGSGIKSKVNTGDHGIRLYRLDATNFEGLFRSLWDDGLWESFLNSKWNPIGGILGLQIMPCDPDGTMTSNKYVSVCGRQMKYDLSLGVNQYVVGDMPQYSTAEKYTIVFRPAEYSHSFLDWGVYTDVRVRIPFVGVVPVDVSKIMDGGIFIKFNIDFITGNVLAQIYTVPSNEVMGEDGDWQSWSYIAGGEGLVGCCCMIGQYAGNCAHKLPVSTSDYGGGGVVGSIISAALGVGTVAIGAFTDNPVVAAHGALTTIGSVARGFTAQHSVQVHPATPNADTMGMLVPALILTRPIDITPLDANGEATIRKNFTGIPAASGGKVKDYKVGYEASEVYIRGVLHADTLYATKREKKEIENAFEKGVYI